MILKWLFPGVSPKGDATPQLNYLEEGKNIWEQFVPKSGQSDTVQGELLRAVEKLRDEAIRNGNGNWDNGFRILLGYIREHLLDPAVYSTVQISLTKSILTRLRRGRDPVLEDEPFDYLSERVVEYYRHYGSQPHTHNPALLR